MAREEVGKIMQNVFFKYGSATNKDALIDECFSKAIENCEKKYPSDK
jgi:hypothetical protein